MGVDGRSSMYPSGCPKRIRNDAMPKQSTATAFDHDSTLVLALELSGKGWEVGAVLPGVSRRPRRNLPAREHGGVAAADRTLEGRSAAGRPRLTPDHCWPTKPAATGSGSRVICWRAASRCRSCIQPASRWNDAGGGIKTDRIDLDMLLRTLLAWLRGEPRVCSIVRIPSEAEEDMRRPEQETRASGERAGRIGEPHRGACCACKASPASSRV